MSWSGLVDPVLDASLTTGPAVVVFAALTAVGLAALAARRRRRWLLVGIPVAVAASVVVTVLAALFIERVWRPFPDVLPISVYAWSALGILAVALLIGRWFVRGRDHARPLIAAGLVVATLAVVAASAGQINALYDAYPTVRTAIGASDYRTVPFDSLKPAAQRTSVADWRPSPDMPSRGAVTTASIPGTTSGFRARAARIYLPPAYFTDPRPDLPVLVLLAGQPGSPEDWLVGGRLVQTMDAYAAEHDGLTPIVVVPDGTGGQFDNPLCIDSPRGNAATYLGVDVPGWVRTHLQVDPDPRAWAIGGLSYGGTCALQLATTRPQVYPTFIDMSGQAEPSLGDRSRTIDEGFGGDAEAFARNNPADLLTRNRYPDSAGSFVVGRSDKDYRAGLEQLVDTARAAGMDVHLTEVPGRHSFVVWSAGLEKELPWLSHRLGLP
ncbi:alpha/beta hydrolase [Nocardia higoensis]|uniref:alpha/beta hydrolase n=1 Tax=Nocardia higoensis TaxID=228599 RepID=UPI00031087C4|nr:alpha/beta hydrolase-fold protein [Nocardia higoensis]